MIAFATYDPAPEGTPDDLFAADRIAGRYGAAVEPVVWNAPSVAWGGYTAVLVRFGDSEAVCDRFAEAVARRLAPHGAVTP